MGDGPIQPVIQPVAINTKLGNNGLNNPRYSGLNFFTCEQTFGLYFCAELSDVFSVNLNKTKSWKFLKKQTIHNSTRVPWRKP